MARFANRATFANTKEHRRCQEQPRPKNAPESKEELLDYLRQMYEIRNFEDTVYKLLREGTIKGASHLYAGQEAVAVGSVAALKSAT